MISSGGSASGDGTLAADGDGRSRMPASGRTRARGRRRRRPSASRCDSEAEPHPTATHNAARPRAPARTPASRRRTRRRNCARVESKDELEAALDARASGGLRSTKHVLRARQRDDARETICLRLEHASAERRHSVESASLVIAARPRDRVDSSMSPLATIRPIEPYSVPGPIRTVPSVSASTACAMA